jgi:hypothetical protein
MLSADQAASAGSERISEVELEVLIAKYTLEYLYRWTNEFDATELAQLRKLLAVSGRAESIVQMMKTGGGVLPS